MEPSGYTLFVNGHIRTMDRQRPVAQAVAVRGDRFVAVGSNSEVLEAFGARARVIDLQGKLVVPGLIDSHVHLLWLGQSLSQLDLSTCTSIAELQRMLKQRAESCRPGEWIVGWGWHQERLKEKRDPCKEDIDPVTPQNPVYLVRSCTHAALVNGVALSLAGITADTGDPPGGCVAKGPGGDPRGLLYESAMQLVASLIPAPDLTAKASMLKLAMEELVKYGITGAHSVDLGCKEAYRVLRSQGDLPLRVYMDEGVESGSDYLPELAWESGDLWLRTGSVKFWADGAFGPRTAALKQPYADDPGNAGLLVYPPERLKELAAAVGGAGRQVTIHALGDRALEVALDAAEVAVEAGARRPRVVHCGLADEALIERMRVLKVIADLQPCFVPYEVDWMPQRLGIARSKWAYAFRSLIQAGICCTAGSDAPVDPVNPFIGIYGAVTRCAFDGHPEGGWNPQQRLTVELALAMYTVNGAYAEFSEGIKGMVKEGFLADMAVLSKDIFLVEPQELLSTKALLTLVGGQPKWVDPEWEGVMLGPRVA
ncbi:MAG: amidohydrolase [Bacillota bacterium]